MTSKSEPPDRTLSKVDGNSVGKPKDKTCLRLRLGRVFSNSGIKSPKSPKSVSSSRGSSPARGNSYIRNRYSWQPGTAGSEENRSPRSPESGVSVLSSSSSLSSPSSKSPLTSDTTNSPKSPSTPKSPTKWYICEKHEVLAAAATATAEAEEVGERRRVRRRNPQPGVATPVFLYGAEELVGVIDAGDRLPLAVHRDVRLDARVPVRVDAAPGRLLKAAAVTSAATPRRKRDRERERERERKRVDRIVS